MNKTRRASLSRAATDIETAMDSVQSDLDNIEDASRTALDWDGLKTDIEAIRTDVEALKDEEQEYHDNMPEGLKGGEKGDAAQCAIDAMENADTNIGDALTAIDEKDHETVISELEQARDYVNEAESY